MNRRLNTFLLVLLVLLVAPTILLSAQGPPSLAHGRSPGTPGNEHGVLAKAMVSPDTPSTQATITPNGEPLTGHTSPVISVDFSPDSTILASGSADITIILWDVATRLGRLLLGHTDTVWSVAFSPDGTILASGSKDTNIILWDVATRQSIGAPLADHTADVRGVAFSPDGTMLASGSTDKTIILWDVATQQPIGAPLTDHTNGITDVAFSPDGTMLASSSCSDPCTEGIVMLWDVATGQPIGAPLTGHTRWIGDIAFSPDGTTLATASDDSTIILWDVATGQPIGDPLTGHTDWIGGVAFSVDGTMLASGSNDNTIRLWDVATQQPIGNPLTNHPGGITSLDFSPDGAMLASGSADTNIMLWDVGTQQPTTPTPTPTPASPTDPTSTPTPDFPIVTPTPTVEGTDPTPTPDFPIVTPTPTVEGTDPTPTPTVEGTDPTPTPDLPTDPTATPEAGSGAATAVYLPVVAHPGSSASQPTATPTPGTDPIPDPGTDPTPDPGTDPTSTPEIDPPTPSDPQPALSQDDALQGVLEETNRYRAEHGCAPLTIDERLATVAQNHATDMALNDYFAHDSPDGTSFTDRINATGYAYSRAAEFIAVGYRTPSDVVKALYTSKAPEENVMLDCSMQEMGIGYYYLQEDSGTSNWNTYWVQLFTVPKGSTNPTPTPTPTEEPGLDPTPTSTPEPGLDPTNTPQPGLDPTPTSTSTSTPTPTPTSTPTPAVEPTPLPDTTPGENNLTLEKAIQGVLAETNRYRIEHGCEPLTLDDQLIQAAQAHADDMALNDYYSHDSLDGSEFTDRIDATGYVYSRAAENIAAGQRTTLEVVTSWFNSPPHRKNMLNCELEEIGIGYHYLPNDTGTTNFHTYWVQVFGTPR